MMEHDALLGPFERLLGDIFTPQSIRALEAGEGWDKTWDANEASGYCDALVPEARDGFGLAWDAAGALFQALGRAASPLPIGETMILRRILAANGKPVPEGPLVAASEEGALHAGVPSVRHCASVALDDEQDFVPLALLYAAQIAGAAGRVLEMSVAYANERQQFGKPIGRQQAVQQQLAVMAQEVIAVRLAVEQACPADGELSVIRVAAAKAVASRYAVSIAATAHAVHGAIGISAEYELQLFTRRLHAWRTAAGSESYWQARIGQAVLSSNETALDWLRSNIEA